MKTLKDELLAAAAEYSTDVHGYKMPTALEAYIVGATQGPLLEKAIAALQHIQLSGYSDHIKLRQMATEALAEIQEAKEALK